MPIASLPFITTIGLCRRRRRHVDAEIEMLRRPTRIRARSSATFCAYTSSDFFRNAYAIWSRIAVQVAAVDAGEHAEREHVLALCADCPPACRHCSSIGTRIDAVAARRRARRAPSVHARCTSSSGCVAQLSSSRMTASGASAPRRWRASSTCSLNASTSLRLVAPVRDRLGADADADSRSRPRESRGGGWISAGMISTVHTPLPIFAETAPKIWPHFCAPSPDRRRSPACVQRRMSALGAGCEIEVSSSSTDTSVSVDMAVPAPDSRIAKVGSGGHANYRELRPLQEGNA